MENSSVIVIRPDDETVQAAFGFELQDGESLADVLRRKWNGGITLRDFLRDGRTFSVFSTTCRDATLEPDGRIVRQNGRVILSMRGIGRFYIDR